MVTRLGNENARALKAILADFRALPNASDLQTLHTVLLSPQGHASVISRAFTTASAKISKTFSSACAAMILACPSLRAFQGAKKGPATASSPPAAISNSLLKS